MSKTPEGKDIKTFVNTPNDIEQKTDSSRQESPEGKGDGGQGGGVERQSEEGEVAGDETNSFPVGTAIDFSHITAEREETYDVDEGGYARPVDPGTTTPVRQDSGGWGLDAESAKAVSESLKKACDDLPSLIQETVDESQSLPDRSDGGHARPRPLLKDEPMTNPEDTILPGNPVPPEAVSSPPSLQEEGRVRGKMKPRLVVVENVYHEIVGVGPQSFVTRYTRWLSSDEQTYTRRTKATREWKTLEFGWVEQCCQITVTNLTPGFNDMVLSEEKVAFLESNVLYLAVVDTTAEKARATGPSQGQGTMWKRAVASPAPVPFAMLYPGESCRFQPFPGVTYQICSTSDPVPFVVNVIPN